MVSASAICVLSVIQPYTPPRHGASDLIVVGSHGRKELTKWLLGSVAQTVAGHGHGR